MEDKRHIHDQVLHQQIDGNFEAVLRTQEIGHQEQRSCDLSDNDDILTPNEELINAIKSNDSEEEKVTVIKKLFERKNKPNINMQDHNNDTPLHISVRRTILKVIEFLVKNGADINIVNSKGRSPLYYAKRIQREDIVEILETPLDSKAKQTHQKTSVIKLEKAHSENNDNNNNICEELRKGISFDIKDAVHSFTGRELELCDLHTKIQRSSQKTTVISQLTSTSGLGGIGKTELARKYIRKHSQDYDDNIVWINAHNEGCIFESFYRLAKDKLGIYTKYIDGIEKDIKSVVEEVYKFFKSKKCLFIFDNVEKQEYLKKFLPLRTSISQTYVLITSRNREWEQQGIEILKLDVLALEDAIKFVTKGLRINDDSQHEDIQKLVEKLQCFPLALQQAVSYIWEQRVAEDFGICNYLVEYEKKRKELLDSKLFKGIDNHYARTTFTTWKITLIKIASHAEYGKLALKLINIIAYFAPDNMYAKLFLNLKDVNETQLKFAIRLLVQYSMVYSDEKQSILNIHRLVQEIIRIHINDPNIEADVLDEALGLLKNNKIDQNNVDHAVSVWGYASKFKKLIKKFGNIPSLIVNVLNGYSRYHEASSFGSTALKPLYRILGNGHDYVTYLQKSLAVVFYNQGKDGDALKIYESIEKKRNVAIIAVLEEPRHLLQEDFCKGLILLRQGKPEKALAAFSQEYDLVLSGIIGSCGNVEHNMGITLMALDLLDDALAMLQKSLKLKEQNLGPDDISTLNTKNSISTLLERQGKYEESLKMSKDIYEKRKEILGPTHPDTLTTRCNIALCLHDLNKYVQALKIAYEVDKEREKITPDHPCVLNGKELIADILYEQSRLDESLQILENVYEKKVKVLGEKHKHTLDNVYKTCLVLTELKRYDEAVVRFERVVNGTRELFGPNDERTLQIKSIVQNSLNDILFHSVSSGNCNFNTVKMVLQKGADVDALHDDGLTPLHFAAQNGHTQTVELLLIKGADINVKTYEHITALHLAVDHEQSKVFELLLNKRADINAKTNNNLTPLYIATQKNNIGFVEQLLEKGASVKTKQITNGYTPLHCAAQNGNSKIVKLLLNKGADINAESVEKLTPLHMGVDRGHMDIVELLLKQGANIDAKDKNSATPLHLAAHKGHLAIVAALLKKGANVNCCDTSLFAPLHFAAQFGHTETVKLLLKHNADIEANCTTEVITELNTRCISKNTCVMGLTALHLAAYGKHLDVVRALLEAGANIDAINELKLTPADATHDPLIRKVILATKMLSNVIRQNQNSSLIKQLLEHGAVINYFSNTTRLTALHYAVSRANSNIVQLLLRESPNVNVRDEDGWSPLHYAVQDGNIDIVELLLTKGADVEIKNSDGQTPLDIAREKLAYDPQIYQTTIDILKAQLH